MLTGPMAQLPGTRWRNQQRSYLAVLIRLARAMP